MLRQIYCFWLLKCLFFQWLNFWKELLLIASHWIEIFWYLLSLDSQLLFLIGFVENYLRFAFFFHWHHIWKEWLLIAPHWFDFGKLVISGFSIMLFLIGLIVASFSLFCCLNIFNCHWIHIVYGLICLMFKKIWCWWLFNCFIVSLALFWRILAVSSFLFAISQLAVEDCCFIICFLNCFLFGKNSYCCLLICLFTHWLHICW